MKISQLVSEKNGLHWVEADNYISFLYSSIEKAKFYSVLRKYENRCFAKKEEGYIWLAEEYGEHESCATIRSLGPRVNLLIEAKLLARYVIVDWKGIVDEEGNQVEYDINSAVDVIVNNKRIRNFFYLDTYELTLNAFEEYKVASIILKIAEEHMDT